MRLTIAQLLPAMRSGGVERGVLEVGRAIAAAGHRSIVVSQGGALVGQLESEGSEHVSLPIGKKSPLTFRYASRLRSLFEREQVDVVHARSRLPAWVGWRAVRSMSRPPAFITTVHGLYSVSRYSSIMAKGDRVIAVSESSRAYVDTHYADLAGDRIVVIPRGIDPEEFPRGFTPSPQWKEAFETRYPTAANLPKLLIVGRWGRRKGHLMLVALLAALRGRRIPCVALVAGEATGRRDERFRRRVRALAVQLDVTDALIEVGQRQDLRELYAYSDVVLSLSSKPESFGRTVLESLSVGTPVVGFDHGGVGELLSAYCPAGKVRPGELESLIDVSARVLSSPPVVGPVDAHSLSAMQKRTLSLYSELVRSARKT